MPNADEKSRLELHVTTAMRNNLRKIAKVIGPRGRFTPNAHSMRRHGKLASAETRSEKPVRGVMESRALDLSLEALLVEHPKLHVLFRDEEIKEMRHAHAIQI